MSPIFAPNTLDFISHSEAQTRRLGARLAELLTSGDVLSLVGDLGSGKTRWAQGVCQGLGVTEPVNSPTFTLVNEYQGRVPVFHIDLYRVSDPSELGTFGLEDYLFGSGISLIEWGDRASTVLPSSYLTIALYFIEDTKRRVVIQPQGERSLKVLADFKEATFAR